MGAIVTHYVHPEDMSSIDAIGRTKTRLERIQMQAERLLKKLQAELDTHEIKYPYIAWGTGIGHVHSPAISFNLPRIELEGTELEELLKAAAVDLANVNWPWPAGTPRVFTARFQLRNLTGNYEFIVQPDGNVTTSAAPQLHLV